MARLGQIEGVGRPELMTLHKAGIRTTDDLLRLAGDSGGRQQLAQKSRLRETQLLDWVNRADLMRVKGIGTEYSDLLEAAGVDTVRELANRAPTNLYQTLYDVNHQKHLTRRSPTATEVESWVGQAKRMQPMVSH
jgi:predicted flap endonuclease-1-like 5' DNA nuclease